MNKKTSISAALFLIVLVFGIFILNKNKEPGTIVPDGDKPAKSKIVLFYGEGCPHCANVEKYLENNDVKNKISFANKEVYYNQKNANEMAAKAKICDMTTDSIGVPFLWDGEKCLIGDVEIINFFKTKTEIQ